MVKMEYKTENKTNTIEVKREQVKNMILAGWEVVKKAKKK